MAIPKNITREHIEKAIEEIVPAQIPAQRMEQNYSLISNGKTLPPKYVISIANKYANGAELDSEDFNAVEAKNFLIKKEFNVIDKRMENNSAAINVWIEKTKVKGRKDRAEGERALGKALWSPKTGSDGRNTYKNMPLVKAGDLVLHLVDNSIISGLSIVAEAAKDAEGLAGTPWDGPSYLIKLKNYIALEKPVERAALLSSKNKVTLNRIAQDSEVFYNNDLTLRQGGYLSPCPIKLLSIINDCYKIKTKTNLPFVDVLGIKLQYNLDTMSFEIKELHKSLLKANLKIAEKLSTRFISSLLTKPFVILTGLSGSGKTKLAQAFAMWICENDEQYCIVPVGADWTNRDPLLGFPNALIENDYKKDEYGVLKLIIEANTNSNKPYFLILDEMNLSHVERYFADFLSVMESKSKISLHSGNEDWNSVPSEIGFPKNLFIIGTVNIDETTYMFSPKVLDRANVIEFRVTKEEMENYLQSNSVINLDNLEGLGANVAGSFVEIAKDDSLEASDTEELNKSLMSFFSELKKTGAEFGYRSASEILRFAAVVNKIETTWNMTDIIDAAIMQKLMPKVGNPVTVTTLRLFRLTRKNVGTQYCSWSIVSGFRWSRPLDFPVE